MTRAHDNEGADPRIREVVALKTLVFDADGVVIVPVHRFVSHYADEQGLEPESIRKFFDGVFQDCLIGKADLMEVIQPYLRQWGWGRTVKEFLQLWFESEHHINSPVVEIVGALRKQGYRCLVATNQERNRLAYMKEQMGFGLLFDGIFGSADVGAVKPNPEFYRRVTKALEVPPEDIVFWDDTERNVIAARQAGWHAERYVDIHEFVVTLQARTGDLGPFNLTLPKDA